MRGKSAVCALALFVSVLMACFWGVPEAHAEKIGVITTRGSEFSQRAHAALQAYLKEKGFGARVQFIAQTPYPDPVAWSNASRKLLAAGVDAIVVYGTGPAIAAVKENPDVPVIYAGVYQPTSEKFHSKKTAGVCVKSAVQSLMRYMYDSGSPNPAVVLYSSIEEDSREQLAEFKSSAGKFRFTVTAVDIRKPADYVSAIADLSGGTIFISSSLVIEGVLRSVIRTAHARKLPTASLMASESPSPILSISPSPERVGQEAARKLMAVLDGTRPAELPVMCLPEGDVIYSLKEAQDMGIKVPISILNDATKVIQ